MTFPQKHEDRPVAPGLFRAPRQEESHARSLVSDPEDVKTAIASLELDRDSYQQASQSNLAKISELQEKVIGASVQL